MKDKLNKIEMTDIKSQPNNTDSLFVSSDSVIFQNTDTGLSKELEYKIKEHSKLCEELKILYATKNADYGDSMHPLFEEYGLTAFLVMFSTKIQRIKNLENKKNINYESLEDSLVDLANYALIAVTELRAKNNDISENILSKFKNTWSED